jgi:hypothetical protein
VVKIKEGEFKVDEALSEVDPPLPILLRAPSS